MKSLEQFHIIVWSEKQKKNCQVVLCFDSKTNKRKTIKRLGDLEKTSIQNFCEHTSLLIIENYTKKILFYLLICFQTLELFIQLA